MQRGITVTHRYAIAEPEPEKHYERARPYKELEATVDLSDALTRVLLCESISLERRLYLTAIRAEYERSIAALEAAIAKLE